MEELRQRDFCRLVDFLRESYILRDLDGFISHLIAGIPALVPSDFTSYTAFNPGQILAQISRPAELVSRETDRLWERYMHENPLVAHHRGTTNGRAVKISDFISQRQLRRTGLYNELHRRLGGIEYQMAFTFPAPPPLIVGMGLNRYGRQDFSERDRLVLNLLRPHLVQAYRNAAAVTQMRADLALLLAGRDAVGQGVALVDSQGRVRLMTARARQWLQKYFNAAPRVRDRLPDALRRWVEHHVAAGGRTDTVPAARTPLVVERPWGCLSVRLVTGGGGHLLLLEERPAAVLPKTLEAAGLSRRESEILACVARGLTNAGTGSMLGISRRTVQKHLERIFEKLAVETRTAAAVRALELAQASRRD